MKKVAIITSGGDGAGINAAIEMISREDKIDLYGFHDSFNGILRNKPIHLSKQYCQNYSLDGKQIIRTARSEVLFDVEGRKYIKRKLEEYGFDYLVICGGDGSQKAAKILNHEGINTLFIPMTIDNDVTGSDYSIGFDTALNRVTNVVHDLHDTAQNMPGRIFMVEVLGGNCGNIALCSAVSTSCDLAIIPEFSTDKQKITASISKKLECKDSIIVICSESSYDGKSYKTGEQGVSFDIADHIEKNTNIRVRKTVMGFPMRSGNPTYRDVMMASQMGTLARECIINNNTGAMIAISKGKAEKIEFENIRSNNEESLDQEALKIAIKNELVIRRK